MKLKCLVFVVAALATFVAAEQKSYSGYKVYELFPENDDQIQVLSTLRNRLDFWKFSGTIHHSSVVMVQPDQEQEILKIWSKYGIRHEVMIDDLERSFQKERQQQTIAFKKDTREGRISFDYYHRHDAINKYLDDLAQKYPQLVQVEQVGRSYENRVMKMIKISNGVGNGTKPLVFIDACIHAREWSTPAFALYIIDQLVENYEQNKDMLEHADWYIVPVVNPDGYEYSHTNVRLWRKTRSLTSDPKCVGVDGNRNYDYNWMATGGNSRPCDETYSGPSATSEPEVRVVSDLLKKYGPRTELYISLHTYGNWLLTPWGHTKDLPPKYDEMLKLGHAVSDAITASTGSKYTVGSTAHLLYYAAGVSNDYGWGVAKIPMSLTWELPGGGQHGFDYPPELIKPMVKETFVGLRVFSDYVAKVAQDKENK